MNDQGAVPSAMRSPSGAGASGGLRTTALRIAAVVAAVMTVFGVVRARRRLHEVAEEIEPPPDLTGAATPLPVQRPTGRVADSRVLLPPWEPEWVHELAAWSPGPRRSPVGLALGYLWASPSTLAGLLVGMVSGALPHVRDGVLVFAPVRGPVAWALARGGFAATTLGHIVVARREPSAALMAHELMHTRQAERLGPFMGPLYWYLLARYGYARHPLEQSARVAGRAARHHTTGQTRPVRAGEPT